MRTRENAKAAMRVYPVTPLAGPVCPRVRMRESAPPVGETRGADEKAPGGERVR
jgi:hypothetical protein